MMIEIPRDLQRPRTDAAELFERIKDIDVVRDLLRTAELGALSDLSPVAGQLKELHSIMLQLGDGGFEVLPVTFAAESAELARDYLDLKSRIGNFDALRSVDPEKDRAALMDVVRESFARISLNALPVLALRRSLMSIDLLKASAKDNPIVAELVRLRDEIVALRDEAKAASEAAQTAAGLTGVSSYAAIFRVSARKHFVAGRYWLAVACCVATGVIAWTGARFWPLLIGPKLSTPELVSALLGKAVILSITGVAIGVCV